MISLHSSNFLLDKNSLNLDSRKGSMAGNVNLIMCRECGYWCTSVEELQSHCMATKHHTFYTTSPSQGFLCRLCQVSLDSLASIREHASSSGHNLLHPKSQPLPNNIQLTLSNSSSCLDNQMELNQTSSSLDLAQTVQLSSTASSLSVLSNTACLNEPDTEDLVVQDEISSDTPTGPSDLVECAPEFLVQEVDQLDYDASKVSDSTSIRNRFAEDEEESDSVLLNKSLNEATLRCSRFQMDEESGFNEVVQPALNSPLLSDKCKSLVCTSCGVVCSNMLQANDHASQTLHTHFTPLVDDNDDQLHSEQRVDNLYNGNTTPQSHDQFVSTLLSSNMKYDNQSIPFHSKSFISASSSVSSNLSAKYTASMHKDIRGSRNTNTSRITKTNRKASSPRNASKCSPRSVSMSSSASHNRNNKESFIGSESLNRSPNHERNTGLTICVQCGKWIASSAGSTAANQHMAETGHRLLLPVKLKGEQTEFRCLVCSESLKRSHHVALHIVYTGHDQFASVCASTINTAIPADLTQSLTHHKNNAMRNVAAIRETCRSPNNRILSSPTRQTSGYLTDESSPSQSQILNSHDDPLILASNKPQNGSLTSFNSSASTSDSNGQFSCNYCSMRLTKSSQLPEHHSRTGHARFTKVVTCATGVAIETWNQSGRMIRGEVLPNKESPPNSSSLSLYAEQSVECHSSNRLHESECDSTDVGKSNISIEEGGKSSNLMDLVTSAMRKNSPGAKLNVYRSISLFIAADMQHEIDEITQQIQSYSNPLLHRPLVHCALCNLSFATFRLLVCHVASFHGIRRDILDKMAYFVRIELNCPEEVDLLVSYACLLCTTYNFQSESSSRLKVSANSEAGQINASFVFSCASALPEHVGTWHCLVCPLCRRVHLKLSPDQKTPLQCCQQYVMSSASSSKASSLRSPPDSSSSYSPSRKRQKRSAPNSTDDHSTSPRKRRTPAASPKNFKWQSSKYLKLPAKSVTKSTKQTPKQQVNTPPIRHRRNSTVSRQ